MPDTSYKMVECNHPGCRQHTVGYYEQGEWNCGRHTTAAAQLEAKPKEPAYDIICDALIEFGGRQIHGANCRADAFWEQNRHCPANHPIWKQAPECNCIIGRMAKWLTSQK